MTRNILMPVKTVAEWGGVHEWTVDAAKALIAAGNKVTFVGEGETFETRARDTGADFIVVDWNNWQESVEAICYYDDFDLIFSHAPAGRQLGLAVNRNLNIEHVVMIHGAFDDRMYEWQSEVDAFLAASPSLVHFAQRFGRVEPWKVTCIPNAAPDGIFDQRLRSFNERLESGVGHIVTASRLAPDKIAQIDVVEQLVKSLSERMPDITWQVDAYGDGPSRRYFEERYSYLERSIGNVRVSLPGWIDPLEVPQRMGEAFAVVTAGMAGMRACAAGSLVVGVGARSNVGVQYGRNLRAGLWSNFGDHGTQQFTLSPLDVDLRKFTKESAYNEMIETCRNAIWGANRQTDIDNRLLSALQC